MKKIATAILCLIRKMVKSNSTESLIESLHASRKNKCLVINPDYLDDEKLPGDERTSVLKEIFNRNIREKQLSRIISHLTPILDGAHPPSALIYGPTGSGKTVTLMHVLSATRFDGLSQTPIHQRMIGVPVWLHEVIKIDNRITI